MPLTGDYSVREDDGVDVQNMQVQLGGATSTVACFSTTEDIPPDSRIPVPQPGTHLRTHPALV